MYGTGEGKNRTIGYAADATDTTDRAPDGKNQPKATKIASIFVAFVHLPDSECVAAYSACTINSAITRLNLTGSRISEPSASSA